MEERRVHVFFKDTEMISTEEVILLLTIDITTISHFYIRIVNITEIAVSV